MQPVINCNDPGSLDCLFLYTIWLFLLAPLEALFSFFGLSFTWELYRP